MLDNNSQFTIHNSPLTNWVETTLGDVCEKITDGTHSTVLDVQDGDCFLLSCKNIKDGNIYIGENERRIDKDTLNFLRKRTELQKNDILLTSVGTIGEVAYVKENDPKYEFQRSVAILKPFDFKINHLFLFYNLKSRKKYLESSAEGAVQQCLFIGRIKEFQILLPPLPEQQAIASVLSAFDDKIELLREENKTLEEMGQALFNYEFRMVNGELGGKKLQKADPKIHNSQFIIHNYLLPEGWRVGKLGEELVIKQGKYVKAENLSEIQTEDKKYPIYGGNGIRGFVENFMYEKPMVVLTCRGNGCGLIQFSKEKSSISNSCMAFENMNSQLNSEFIYFLSKKIDFESVTSGSAQPQITVTNLYNLEIIIPDQETLKQFDEAIQPIFAKIRDNSEQIQSLARSRDELLPRLMSGEVRVK